MKLKKWFHRWILDSLIEKPPPLACILLCVFGSVFFIGFWCAHWIDEVNFSKYSKLYDVFSDNIGGHAGLNSMRDLLPIDVVYTWVNGSDPLVTKNLKKYMNLEISSCSNVDCFKSSYYTLELDTDEDEESYENKIYFVQTSKVKKGNISKNFAIFLKDDNIDANDFIAQLKLLKPNSSVEQAYWTTDSKMDWSIVWTRGIIIRLDTNMEIHIEISNISPQTYKDFTEKCTITKHLGLMLMECVDESTVKKILEDYDQYQIRTKAKYPKLWPARLILHADVSAKELDSSRFEDNEELRYSLRSLEKFAPWVRRVFLVTNGQIPNWLNLDHPRLSIITHEEIFSDLSHLPTFSSPAIEAHIRRIPGLARFFLYFNDDIILGDTIHPDDFFSSTSGYKVYLSWYIPDCASGCPGTWLGDGYCDQTCNTSACFWDGGDCTKPKDQQMFRDNIYDMEEEEDQFPQESEFCAPACSYSWLADTYCDSACSTRSCGFDAGDCGTKLIKENLHKLSLEVNTPNDERFIVPKGELSAWVDMKPLMDLDQNSTLKGSFSYSKGIAVGSFNVPLEILVFIFKPNSTDVIQVDLDIVNNMGESSKKIHFHIQYNTLPIKISPTVGEDISHFNNSEKIANYSFHLLSPRILNQTFPSAGNNSSSDFPVDKESMKKALYNRYLLGELTDKGFKLMNQKLNKKILGKDQDAMFDKNNESKQRKNAKSGEIESQGFSVNKMQNLVDHERTLEKKTSLLNESEDRIKELNQSFDIKKEIVKEARPDLDVQDKMVEKKQYVAQIENSLRQLKKEKKYNNDNGKKNPLKRFKEQLKEDNYINKLGLDNKNKFGKRKHDLVDNEKHSGKKQSPNDAESRVALDKQKSKLHKFDSLKRSQQYSKNNLHINKTMQSFVSNNTVMDKHKKNANVDKLIKFKNKKKKFNNSVGKNITNFNANRKLMSLDDDENELLMRVDTGSAGGSPGGSFPWERRSESFTTMYQPLQPNFSTGRKLLDKYKDSLIYVNQLFNLEYGFQARKVPAHMPHFIDKEILEEVQDKFSHEFQVTSSHKIREGNDMQFAFSYFYYLLSEKRQKSIEEIFDDYDTDLSGTWSDREIRSLLTKLYDLPLQFRYFVGLHNDIKNCSEIVKPKEVSTPPYERYADSDVPTVSKELVVRCENSNLWKKFEKLKMVNRFPHSVLSDSVVQFKMITSNVSRVVHHLDDIRKNSRKFICLNNNMDSKSSENDLVRALMQDTYESLFPVPSSFELPMNYRNRFSYTWQLQEWKRWKYLLRSLIYAFLSCLIFLTLTAFFSSEIESFKKRWLKRGRRRKVERGIPPI